MRSNRWFVTIAAVLGLALVGVVAYNAGVSQGLAQAAVAAAQAGQGTTGTPLPPYPYAYGWYRPWGFGFGFPIFFLFLFFWLFVVRGLFWGRPWRRWHDYGGVPPSFEEWHRRAHDRMQEGTRA